MQEGAADTLPCCPRPIPQTPPSARWQLPARSQAPSALGLSCPLQGLTGTSASACSFDQPQGPSLSLSPCSGAPQGLSLVPRSPMGPPQVRKTIGRKSPNPPPSPSLGVFLRPCPRGGQDCGELQASQAQGDATTGQEGRGADNSQHGASGGGLPKAPACTPAVMYTVTPGRGNRDRGPWVRLPRAGCRE